MEAPDPIDLAHPPQWGAEMDRKLKSFSMSSNSAPPPRALKSVVAVAIAVGLVVGAFPAAVSTPGAASTGETNTVPALDMTNTKSRLTAELLERWLAHFSVPS
jgi:hypothetical protein